MSFILEELTQNKFQQVFWVSVLSSKKSINFSALLNLSTHIFKIIFSWTSSQVTKKIWLQKMQNNNEELCQNIFILSNTLSSNIVKMMKEWFEFGKHWPNLSLALV